MVEVKTKDGFKAKIDERILTDWRFTSALVKTQKGSDLEKLKGADAIPVLLLGDDGFEKLCEHIASKNDGFVPSEAVMNSVAEMISSVKQTKN